MWFPPYNKHYLQEKGGEYPLFIFIYIHQPSQYNSYQLGGAVTQC